MPNSESLKQAVDVINSELITLSKSLRPYLTAQRRIERRIEHLVRRKDRIQRTLVAVTKVPPKLGKYHQPTYRRPTKESILAKIKAYSQRHLTELTARLDLLDVLETG